ncbi:glutamate racemase [Oceanispirochaeta sp.]|uniref:glutamate racemase n=1 Tax=Oceanispirochaeta sp. TaxID=2035350 RepID=UPI0026063FE6|nr:glutamate racemase [Oceanispirochaeta sp.]MDA3955557.1 glutamate racemase [Oceanispirochaeta sp.]
MINRVPLVFFMDSGLGGLPYLQWVKNEKPHWQFVYLADHSCFPYGSRSTPFLKERLVNITSRIVELHHPDLVVVACNTASVTALDTLRDEFSIPFVGVVPAVKPAAQTAGVDKIAVLATDKTVKGKYLKALIRQFAPDQVVETRAASDLVDFVENHLFLADEEEIKEALDPYISLILEKQWKVIVLGCTHFILLKPWFEKWLPQNISIIDSTEGVGRRILHLLPEDLSSPFTGQVPENIFHITGNQYNEKLYKTVAAQYQMILSPLKDKVS